MISRRTFLQAACISPLFNPALMAADARHDDAGLMLASCSDGHEQHYLAMLRLQSQQYKLIRLAERGHALAAHPLKPEQAVVVSRRPGYHLSLIDIDQAIELETVKVREDRHLYGHCSYSPDGKYLLTTENDFERGRGVIGIRDSQSLKLMDEIPAYGIGPHDLHYFSDENLLIVANGGILTHPDTGRRKLNLNEMKPCLSYIEMGSHRLVEQFYLPDPKLSIRHIDVDVQGRVGIATQDQAEFAADANKQSLVAMQQEMSKAPQLIEMSEEVTMALNRYTADFCFANKQQTALVSSPRGNLVLLVDTKRGVLKSTIELNQPSAVALTRDQRYFVISTAIGEVHFVEVQSAQLKHEMTQVYSGLKWDNHMVIV